MEKQKPVLTLTKKPKGAIVVEGFPGFGLVSTIATGFLIDHLKCEQIGTCHFENIPPTLAIHGCKIVDQVGVFYCKKYNLIIIHSIAAPVHIEWDATDVIIDICKQLQVKELISIEGVGSAEGKTRAFYYADDKSTKKKFEEIGIECIGEGVIVGVTAGLMQKYKNKHTALFAETQSQLPDSKAAAKIVEVLDKYLELKVDYAPLLAQAEKFEAKLKGILKQSEQAKAEQDKKQLSYMG